MVVTWVGEKMRWPPSLAAAKRLATRVERGSERASCILDDDSSTYSISQWMTGLLRCSDVGTRLRRGMRGM